jgi:hypothetical protein
VQERAGTAVPGWSRFGSGIAVGAGGQDALTVRAMEEAVMTGRVSRSRACRICLAVMAWSTEARAPGRADVQATLTDLAGLASLAGVLPVGSASLASRETCRCEHHRAFGGTKAGEPGRLTLGTAPRAG